MQLEVRETDEKDKPWGLYLNGHLLGYCKARRYADFAKNVLEREFRIPRCPRCGSAKLSCRDGHTWNID